MTDPTGNQLDHTERHQHRQTNHIDQKPRTHHSAHPEHRSSRPERH